MSGVILDFQNGVYTIDGVSKTLAQCVEAGAGTFAYSDIVPGIGWKNRDNVTTVGYLTAEAFAGATGGNPAAGVSLEMTVDITFNRGRQVRWFPWQRYSVPADISALIAAGSYTSTTGPVPSGTANPYTDYHNESAIPTNFPNYGGGYEGSGTLPADGSAVGPYIIVYAGMVNAPVPQGVSNLVLLGGGMIRWDFYENQLRYEYYPLLEEYVGGNCSAVVAMGDGIYGGWTATVQLEQPGYNLSNVTSIGAAGSSYAGVVMAPPAAGVHVGAFVLSPAIISGAIDGGATGSDVSVEVALPSQITIAPNNISSNLGANAIAIRRVTITRLVGTRRRQMTKVYAA